MVIPETLESYLLSELRARLPVPQLFTDELIRLNLLYLFSQDDSASLQWVAFIESRFEISIPDHEVDYFFFSSLEHMAAVIIRHSPAVL
ncbi:hypothetical protein [Chitinophaga sancti]|uniref:Phosphopantetheine attachment site n=1 Tax=Chitinophaga sancti TaxID=1004 RepID=A0A1K1LUZ8_9BACT|nr:hypothetical protein [Chitinophaga sancti]WQD64901.1 hypothetical protein U0033_10895 [Chitinophaga sancti]WQG89475.1 hypothetical protein SR876_31575 [Chitinophaga sancti]SFW13494.1 hypothetical protein SAMN05661012_00161 [Chitinophaga sancti]